MSKSGRNWFLMGALAVSGAILVTSVAVGVEFWKHPPSRTADPNPTQHSAGADVVLLPQHVVLSPLMIQGSVPVTPALEWRTSERAGPFPGLGDNFGQSADVDIRNPGVRIDDASTGEDRERPVPQLFRRRLPAGSPGNISRANRESGTAESPDLLGTNRLSSEINARRSEIGRCADRRSVAGGRVPPPAGKLALRWVVRTDGSSNDLEVKENTLGNPRFSKCVLDTVGRWRFSPPGGGDAPVESTFVFL